MRLLFCIRSEFGIVYYYAHWVTMTTNVVQYAGAPFWCSTESNTFHLMSILITSKLHVFYFVFHSPRVNNTMAKKNLQTVIACLYKLNAVAIF